MFYIMRFLATDHLLKVVRTVCRRWWQLAVHRDVWRRVRRTASTWYPGSCARALRLAPRLQSLVVSLSSTDDGLAELLCATDCAVERLVLSAQDAVTWTRTLPLAVRVLEHLAPHLRHLDLKLGYGADAFIKERQALLRVALNLQGLEQLTLGFIEYESESFRASEGVTLDGPFLRGLSFGPGVGQRLRCLLLIAHRQTLTAVDMQDVNEEPRAELEALVQCTNLKKLTVAAMVYLPRILSCLPSLTDLHLNMDYFPMAEEVTSEERTAWITLFKSAVGIRELRFGSGALVDPGYICKNTWKLVVQTWLRALALSGESALQALRFYGFIQSKTFLGFRAALPGLRQLRELEVWQNPPEKMVDSISAETAPNLNVFKINVLRSGKRPRVSVEPIHRLLTRLPSLHVIAHGFCWQQQEHVDLGHDEDEVGFWICGLLSSQHPPRNCAVCLSKAAAEIDTLYWHRLTH